MIKKQKNTLTVEMGRDYRERETEGKLLKGHKHSKMPTVCPNTPAG